MHIGACIHMCTHVTELVNYTLVSLHIFLKIKAQPFSLPFLPADTVQEQQRAQELDQVSIPA